MILGTIMLATIALPAMHAPAMMLGIDPLYFLFIAPAALLAMWAQFKVQSAYHEMSQVRARAGLTGAQAADHILAGHGINDVRIEQVEGTLSDHYDPRHKVLRLSRDVYHGTSLSAVGIAAHEAGHAIQHKERYGPLVIRNGIVPMAMVGPILSMIVMVIGGAMLAAKNPAGGVLIMIGIALFSLVVIFQLVNLPVEFDASNRAKRLLVSTGIITADEQRGVNRVLSAAALTYVAATLMAVLQLAYYVFRFAGSSRDER